MSTGGERRRSKTDHHVGPARFGVGRNQSRPPARALHRNAGDQIDGSGRALTGVGCPRTRGNLDVGHRPRGAVQARSRSQQLITLGSRVAIGGQKQMTASGRVPMAADNPSLNRQALAHRVRGALPSHQPARTDKVTKPSLRQVHGDSCRRGPLGVLVTGCVSCQVGYRDLVWLGRRTSPLPGRECGVSAGSLTPVFTATIGTWGPQGRGTQQGVGSTDCAGRGSFVGLIPLTPFRGAAMLRSAAPDRG